MLLEVAQDVRVDLTLTPGEQTQTVTVTEETPAIDTTNATLGGTITNQSITSLPLISRNFLQLLQLRPGVVDVPGGTGTATVTNGRREGADVLLVEGVTQFDLATSNVLINGANKGGGVNQLPLDAIQEFSTQQNSPAEYGWRDGSAINVGVKSGTNSIHGIAYAFGRDAARPMPGRTPPPGTGRLAIDCGAARLHAGWPAYSRTSSSVSSPPNLSVSQFQHGCDHDANGYADGRLGGQPEWMLNQAGDTQLR